MFHIVYVSTATRPFSEADAGQVLDDARAFNAQHGVTGLLVHTSTGGFLQALEGSAEAVESAYRRAAASSRHHTILRTPAIRVPERVFHEWAMGFERVLPRLLVDRVLQPLVDHRLLDGQDVKAILLERWGVTAGAAASHPSPAPA